MTERFWRAVISDQPAKLERYVLDDQRDAVSIETLLNLKDFAIGRAVIDAETAAINVKIMIDGDPPLTLDTVTSLRVEHGQWRVDYETTIATVSQQSQIAKVIEGVAEIGSKLEEGLGESMQELAKLLPSIQSELEKLKQKFIEGLPELENQLKEFREKIEKEIPLAPPERPEEPPQETIEI
ncbi:MAG: hypothetical protein AAF384_05010 [Pseudomonadota bacterium]